MERDHRHVIFLLIMLLLFGYENCLSSDSNNPAIKITTKPLQLTPTFSTALIESTPTTSSVAKTPSPTQTCSDGFAMTRTNVDEAYYWDMHASSTTTYQWKCDVDDIECVTGGRSCLCEHSRGCPGGCIFGCNDNCERRVSNTTYTAGWSLSSYVLANGSSDYAAKSYRCSKVINQYKAPSAATP